MFKLRDLLRRAGGLRRGSAVLELGCWPGGWLQVLAEMVGPQGRVVGVDLRPLEPVTGVKTLELDFTDPEALATLQGALEGQPVDALLSDAAPTLTGIRDVDRGAAEELYASALYLAGALLRRGGPMIVKGFPGPGADAFRKELRAAFERVTEVRPEGRRQTSKEFYWVCTNYDPS